VELALKLSNLSFQSLGVIFLSDQRITYYNRRYLGRCAPTDVLSFSLGKGEGEILISAERAVVQAKRYRLSPEKELLTLVIHGILHLAGWRDKTERERKAMSAATRKILRRLATFPE